jgi:hypothetical protein
MKKFVIGSTRLNKVCKNNEVATDLDYAVDAAISEVLDELDMRSCGYSKRIIVDDVSINYMQIPEKVFKLRNSITDVVEITTALILKCAAGRPKDMAWLDRNNAVLANKFGNSIKKYPFLKGMIEELIEDLTGDDPTRNKAAKQNMFRIINCEEISNYNVRYVTYLFHFMRSIIWLCTSNTDFRKLCDAGTTTELLQKCWNSGFLEKEEIITIHNTEYTDSLYTDFCGWCSDIGNHDEEWYLKLADRIRLGEITTVLDIFHYNP